MSEVQQKNCSICGKLVIDVNGTIVHAGGGVAEQKCQNCGWTGGQAGRYTQCPRCGDMTSLVDDHVAS